MNIIKYGGSKVSPTADLYNDEFIDELIGFVNQYPTEKFMVIIGGGAKARQLQGDGEEMLQKLYSPDTDLIAQGKDLLGIKATRENARYVINRFQKAGIEKVCPEVLYNPTKKMEKDFRIYFSGGWKPGNSTDYVTMMFAKTYDAEKIIKISDFEIVKNVSPLDLYGKSKEEMGDLLKAADDLPTVTWDQMSQLVGTEWLPGLNTPLDPPAAKYGTEHPELTLYIARETELKKILEDKLDNFKGTIIKR